MIGLATELLRSWARVGSECTMCETLMGDGYCSGGGSCTEWMRKLADMAEAELEEAMATRCTAYIDRLASLGRVPGRRLGETLEKWLGRCFVPVPRYVDGSVVEPGSVSYWGTVEWVDVEVSDNGWGNWTLHIAETSETVDGTLNQRVPRGLLVEGKPVKNGDKLWFGTDEVTVTDVDGLSGTIFTDYLTEDTDGERFPYPFEPSELSWEKPEVPDTIERIKNDSVKSVSFYWNCGEWDCSECEIGPTPKERYGVYSCFEAMQLDIIRRTEEVCKR